MNKDLFDLIQTLVFVSASALVLVILTHIRRNLRSYRLRKLANKYNLQYVKNFQILNLFYPDALAFNEITGTLGTHAISICDLVEYRCYGMEGCGIGYYTTILKIDNSVKSQPKNSFIGIGKIDSELRKISTPTTFT